MSKKTLELAKKILAKYAELEPTDREAIVVRAPIIGFMYGAVKTEKVKVQDHDREGNPIEGAEVTEVDKAVETTEKEALAIAAEVLAAQLDDESIILSDTWAEDHL